MGAAIGSISVLLFGTALLLLGNGLQVSLVALRAAIEGFPQPMIGLIMAGYFIGFVIGSYYGPALVRRAGHIRVFAALASVASAVALLLVLLPHPWVWWLLRIITGFCFAGLYTVIESWLNERASNSNRGVVLSFYMVVTLGALAAGQQLLGLASPASYELFLVVSVLISLALVPITLTRGAAPMVVETAPLSLRQIYAITPLGLAVCLGSGLATGAFWGLLGHGGDLRQRAWARGRRGGQLHDRHRAGRYADAVAGRLALRPLRATARADGGERCAGPMCHSPLSG